MGNSINDHEGVPEVLKSASCSSGLPLTTAANGQAVDGYIQPPVARGIVMDGLSL